MGVDANEARPHPTALRLSESIELRREASAARQITTRTEILPILVLYKAKLADSQTFQTYCASSADGKLDRTVLAVYDNSPERQVSDAEEKQLLAYRHDPGNSGLAAAYNWALDIARLRGFSWLLLLDQDTALPATFIPSLQRAASLYDSNESVVAIVPIVTDQGAAISPKRVRLGRLAPPSRPAPPVADYEITAINSGAAVKVSFLESIAGFNPLYRLDCLDHWLFRQIYAKGKKTAISGELLDHNLSVSDYRHQVCVARYRSILEAEALFVSTEKSYLERVLYLGRLSLRAVKQLIVHRRPRLSVLTASAMYPIAMRLTRFAKDVEQ